MDYNNMTKKALIEKIEALENLTKQVMEDQENDLKLDYSWSGNLGHWYWDIKTNTVTFNARKATNLGYTKEELPENVPYQFFTDKLHEDDYEPTMQAMRDHLSGKKDAYEVEYRIKGKDGEYRWYYDRGTITKKDDEGNPLFLSGIVFDITDKLKEKKQLEIKNKELTKQSTIDPLTNINNRRVLFSQLTNEMNRANYTKTTLTVGMYDIDNFKEINDTYGHVYGDKVLKNIAEIMHNELRDSDIVGRYGGEEFMIIFPSTKRNSAKNVSNRILDKVQKTFKEEDKTITLSGGLAVYDKQTIETFIEEADKNLYKAKNTGKNKVI